MVSNCKLFGHGADAFHDPILYRSVVGALQYSTLIRPETSFAVNKVCQFMAAPLDSHWTVVKRILRYLKGTLSHGLFLQPTSITKPLIIRAFCDADWASDVVDRRSTSGIVIFLGPNLISWWFCKQKVTARSSTKAEYCSITQTSTELTWIHTLLAELQVAFTTLVIFCDNQSASHNPVFHSITKQMEIDCFLSGKRFWPSNSLLFMFQHWISRLMF